MGTLELKINDELVRIGKYPSTWDEMSGSLYLKVCRLLALNTEINDAKIKILQAVFNLKLWFNKPCAEARILFNLPALHLHTILHNENILGYIFKPTGPTKLLIPSFRYRFKKFIAPPVRLTNVCTEELIAAWYAFSQYSKTSDTEYLDKLISLLYRPARHRSISFYLHRSGSSDFEERYAMDKREPLNQLRWNQRAEAIKNMDYGLKIAILKQFSGHWAEFEAKYPTIFTRNVKKESNGTGLMGLMYDMSGKIFGTLKETAQVNADEFFFYVHTQIQKNKEQEKNLKKHAR